MNVKLTNSSGQKRTSDLNRKIEIVESWNNKDVSFARFPDSFVRERSVARLRYTDKNRTTGLRSPSFTKYTKSEVTKYLENPWQNASRLRAAILYIYQNSSHFRRLIQYFTMLTDWAYVVSPYRIDPEKEKHSAIKSNYRRTMNLLSLFDVRTQFPQLLTVCLREDVFYGTIIETRDCVSILRLPSDYCAISTKEDNVFNVTFDFDYFSAYPAYLEYYPDEFVKKYNLYKNAKGKSKRELRWQELDSPNSFAIKANFDIPEYPIPPFQGILRGLYDLETYKDLKLASTELENYAMLAMKIPTDDDGGYLIDYNKAEEFWRNLDSVLPPEIGSVLTPMDIQKFSFEKSNTGDSDTVSEAEEELFSDEGVSSLLFNNKKAAASALLLSIKVDQGMTWEIVKQIEVMLNRYLHSKTYGKKFKISFINSSTFNQKEVADQYLKAATYGFPTLSLYMATTGLEQDEVENMNMLEQDILGLQKKFIPLQSSNTMSSEAQQEANNQNSSASKDDSERSEKREQNEEYE